MAEVEKLLKAKFYCEKLANGIDPISDKAMPADSVLNQVQLARFFFFLKEYIGEELKPTHSTKSSPSGKQQFIITQAALAKVDISTKPVSISEFAKRVSQYTNPDSKLFSHKWVMAWLIQAGFLAVSEVDGKKYPTPAGNGIGISIAIHSNGYTEYKVVQYDENAQRFLLDNMDAILEPQGYCVIQ